MIPSVLSQQLRRGVEDFLRTTFPVSTPFFHGMVDRLLAEEGGVFKGPYVSIQLPFREGEGERDFFPDVPLRFKPYLHQERAFRRLSGPKPRSTLVATGTGSITYLTAMGARAAIWIVSDPRPEHVAAIAWLNESSSAAFYMVKVEAVRIGESPPAALFTLIVGSSDEAKDVGHTKEEIAERYGIRKRWWTLLIERSAEVSKLHAHITPGEYSWIGTSAGVRGLNLNYAVTQDGCGAELYTDRGKDSAEENKAIFDQLHDHREEIESAFGGPLKWERLEGKRASRIQCALETGGYRSPEETWPRIQDEIIEAMNRLEQALRPHLRKLKLG